MSKLREIVFKDKMETALIAISYACKVLDKTKDTKLVHLSFLKTAKNMSADDPYKLKILQEIENKIRGISDEC